MAKTKYFNLLEIASLAVIVNIVEIDFVNVDVVYLKFFQPAIEIKIEICLLKQINIESDSSSSPSFNKLFHSFIGFDSKSSVFRFAFIESFKLSTVDIELKHTLRSVTFGKCRAILLTF
jgi:hypothetical protein